MELGHAEDCPGCVFAGLTDEDRAWFVERGYADPAHRQREAPPEPVRAPFPLWPVAAVLAVWAAVAVMELLWGPALLGWGLLGLEGVFGTTLCSSENRLRRARHEHRMVAWRAEFAAWQDEQRAAAEKQAKDRLPQVSNRPAVGAVVGTVGGAARAKAVPARALPPPTPKPFGAFDEVTVQWLIREAKARAAQHAEASMPDAPTPKASACVKCPTSLSVAVANRAVVWCGCGEVYDYRHV